MFRKDLIDLLLGNPMGVSQIARPVKESPSQIADDLQLWLAKTSSAHKSLICSSLRPSCYPCFSCFGQVQRRVSNNSPGTGVLFQFAFSYGFCSTVIWKVGGTMAVP